jgi:hypothetical protein
MLEWRCCHPLLERNLTLQLERQKTGAFFRFVLPGRMRTARLSSPPAKPPGEWNGTRIVVSLFLLEVVQVKLWRSRGILALLVYCPSRKTDREARLLLILARGEEQKMDTIYQLLLLVEHPMEPLSVQ